MMRIAYALVATGVIACAYLAGCRDGLRLGRDVVAENVQIAYQAACRRHAPDLMPAACEAESESYMGVDYASR